MNTDHIKVDIDDDVKSTKPKLKHDNLIKPKKKNIKIRLSKNKSLYLMARCNKEIGEFDRKQILFHELETFDTEVRTKNIHTQCKANIFRFANIISSFIVIVAGAIIVGLQATNPCISIPSLVLAGLLTTTQSLYEVFRWGPQGLFFKQATIRLKRVRRQINDIKLMIHQYTADQVMNEIRHMRNEYDDIDFTTYKMSTGESIKFQANTLEVVNDPNQLDSPFSNSNPSTPVPHLSNPIMTNIQSMNHHSESPIVKHHRHHLSDPTINS